MEDLTTRKEEFCCTCLCVCTANNKLISLNYVPAKDISYKFKLKSCVPEMALEDPDGSFLCKACLASLENAYTFRCMCLRTEGKLSESRQAHKKNIDFTDCLKRIKQEVIEPMSCEEEPEIYFTEHEEFPKEIETKSLNKNLLKNDRNVDQLDSLGINLDDIADEAVRQVQRNPEISIFNSIDSEVELLRVDNGMKVKLPSPSLISTAKSSPCSIQIIHPAVPNTPPVTFTKKNPPVLNEKKIQVVHKDKLNGKQFTDIELVEIACQTIPALIAHNCDASSLDCRVSLERINVTENTVVIPAKKSYKKKYVKKPINNYAKPKKDINYWCHICLKYIAIGRRHRYNAHMLNHKNIKAYKCNKCPKRFTYGETCSKHKKECNGLAPIPPQFQILPSIKIKTENNLKIVQNPVTTLTVKKIKSEPVDEDDDYDWTDEAKGIKYRINNLLKSDTDGEARRSLRTKAINKQLYSVTNDVYHCEICEYQTYKKHQYQVHMMKHFNDRRFDCTQCPKKFFENWELNRHLRTVHLSNVVTKRPPPNSYALDNLPKLEPRQTSISEHTDDTNDSDGTIFARMLEPSVSLTVTNETVVTPVIQSIESLAEDVADDVQVSFSCKVCHISFKSHNLLMLHIQTHKLKYMCNICGLSFITNPEYIAHVKSHSTGYNVIDLVETHLPPKLPPKKKKKKKFFCTICSLEFASKDHANIHTGAKPYDCKVCGKEFAAYSTLRKHRWTHLDEPRNNSDMYEPEAPQRLKYSCEICNKVFINKWQVYSHTCHSASGEAVYRCQICKNAFVGRTALIEHMGIHVNQSGDYYQ